MDIILLLLLTYNCNFSYNKLIFIWSLFFFNNKAINTCRTNLYSTCHTNYNFSHNMNIQDNCISSYDVAITNTDCQTTNFQSNNSQDTQLEYSKPISQVNSSKDNNPEDQITLISEITSQKNNPLDNTKTTPISKIPSSRNNSTHKSKTKKDHSSSILNTNQGTYTIICANGEFTGKIIKNFNNIITLKLENNDIVHINKNYILSYY